MSTTNRSPDIYLGINADTYEPVSLPQHLLYHHTLAFGSAGAGKTVHQHNVMQQLAETGHGYCYLNARPHDIEKLKQLLPDHRLDDILHLDDNSQVYTQAELTTAITNGQIIIVEHDPVIDHPEQRAYMTEFLTDFWTEIQNHNESFALFIDRFHQITALTDHPEVCGEFDYADFLARARGERLAVHINTMFPSGLPDQLCKTLLGFVDTLLVFRLLNPKDSVILADRLGVAPEDVIELKRFHAWTDLAESDESVFVTELEKPTE